MAANIREYDAADRDALVELSLRAWMPVFASVEGILGTELSTLLHGEDWRSHEARSVRETLAAPGHRAWVAEDGARPAGFVVATTSDPERRIGEIVMIAVDPAQQRKGLGHALTEHATAWLRDAGMLVAFIATGGDPGHAPARRVYERAGYRLLPAAQYFKRL